MHEPQYTRLIPFLKNERECNITYCKYNKDKQCHNRDVDLFEYALDYIGSKLIVDSDKREATLDDGTMFTCTYYELDDKMCPECHSKLIYNKKEVNYICYACGHGMKD